MKLSQAAGRPAPAPRMNKALRADKWVAVPGKTVAVLGSVLGMSQARCQSRVGRSRCPRHISTLTRERGREESRELPRTPGTPGHHAGVDEPVEDPGPGVDWPIEDPERWPWPFPFSERHRDHPAPNFPCTHKSPKYPLKPPINYRK